MNRTKIEWLRNPDGTPGYTWNPWGWGCYGPTGTAEKPALCGYCYAKRRANRRMTKCQQCNDFIPHWHPGRLLEPVKLRKPSRIFCGSMCDPFGDWVTPESLDAVLDVIGSTPQHTYYMLTKQPWNIMDKLYGVTEAWPVRELGGNDYVPNLWLGVSVTNAAEHQGARFALRLMAQCGWHTFYSIEPLLRWFVLMYEPVHWAIMGAMTGPGAAKHQPDPDWVTAMIADLDNQHIPVFVKSSLAHVSIRQEWPQ